MRIGPNAIVAGGSVVTKDVLPGEIVAGNPAKVVGNFFDLMEKRKIEDYCQPVLSDEEKVQQLWDKFAKKRKNNSKQLCLQNNYFTIENKNILTSK